MPSQYFNIVLLLVMVGWIWFGIFRPQKAKQQKIREQQKNLAVGDRIVTIGGLKGNVTYVGEDDFTIDVNGTTLTFKKWALSTVEHDVIE